MLHWLSHIKTVHEVMPHKQTKKCDTWHQWQRDTCLYVGTDGPTSDHVIGIMISLEEGW